MSCDDPLIIGLMSMTVFTTSVIFALIFYICKIKSRCKCKRTSAFDTSESKETLIKAHRTSVPNRYEVDAYDFQINKLHRTRSAPIKPIKSVRVSEYDPITCSSVTPNPESSNQRKTENSYEDVRKPSEPYGSIINHVVDSLTTIYSDKNDQTDIQQKFLQHLINAMKAKNVKLLENQKNSVLVEKHHYEEIDEQKPKRQVEYDSDSSYAVFVGNKKKHDDKEIQEKIKRETRESVFGSTDHLKYLKKNKSLSNLVENELDYLKPYEFIAKNGCPEDLKKLCNHQVQDSAYNTLDHNEKPGLEYQITDLSAKFFQVEKTKIKLPRSRTLSDRAVTEEKMTKLQPKKSYSTSHQDVYF